MNRKKENRLINKKAILAIITAVSLGISAFLCGCADKAGETTSTEPTEIQTNQPTPTASESILPSPSPTSQTEQPLEPSPVSYEKKVLSINGRQNNVFLLKVDISDPDVSVIPYLAFDRIFGFEYLQGMAEATDAAAAVNAGFFFEYGLPSGLVVSNGEIISAGTGKFYSLVIEDGAARFEIIRTELSIEINGQVIEIESYNQSPGDSATAAFSDYYGATDRLGYLRRIVVIENNIVKEYRKSEAPADIPKNGYVIMLPADYEMESNPTGKPVTVKFTPSFGEDTMAYECASLLVEDGISLAGDTMPWVGNLNHYDPRTCVGVLDDGRLGFVVIDGRQPNNSSGTTGRETADLLIDLGFVDAVMLDGGASSQMIIDGLTVNSPSSGPEGRPIAGGFMVILNE